MGVTKTDLAAMLEELENVSDDEIGAFSDGGIILAAAPYGYRKTAGSAIHQIIQFCSNKPPVGREPLPRFSNKIHFSNNAN